MGELIDAAVIPAGVETESLFMDRECEVVVHGKVRVVGGPVHLRVEDAGEVGAARCSTIEVNGGIVGTALTGRAVIRGGHVGSLISEKLEVYGGKVLSASVSDSATQHGGTVWSLHCKGDARVLGGVVGSVSSLSGQVVADGKAKVLHAGSSIYVGPDAVLDSAAPAATVTGGRPLRTPLHRGLYSASSSEGEVPVFPTFLEALKEDGTGPVRWCQAPLAEHFSVRHLSQQEHAARMSPVPGLWDEWRQAAWEVPESVIIRWCR